MDSIRIQISEKPNWMNGTGMIVAHIKWLNGFALKSRLPSVYALREGVDEGGLMSYGADRAESYRRFAYYVNPEGSQTR